MNRYLLIIYSSFKNEEDAIEFCNNTFPYEMFTEPKYILENDSGILIRFDCDKSQKELNKILNEKITIPNINMYLLLSMDSLISAYLPLPVKKFLYDDEDAIDSNMIKPKPTPKSRKMTAARELKLDDILEKIKNKDVNSLTKREKQFLDKYNGEKNE